MKITIISAMAACIAAPLLVVAQAESVDPLKTKYEADGKQFDQACEKQKADALEEYWKEVSDAAEDLKRKGDLDAFLLLDAECKRFAKDRKPAATNGQHQVVVKAVADYEASVKKAQKDWNAKMAALTKQYLKSLEDVVKQLTRSDKIEEAKAVKKEVDRVNWMLSVFDEGPKTVEVPANKSAQKLVLVAEAETFDIDSNIRKWIGTKGIKATAVLDGIELSASDKNAGQGPGRMFPLETVEEFKPPFVVKATVLTKTVDIRFHWRRKEAFTFNQEFRVGYFRVYDPATGQVTFYKGKGYVTPSKWHNVVWEVDPDAMRISVDGKLVLAVRGNYANLGGKVGVYTSQEGKVAVKAFSVSKSIDEN